MESAESSAAAGASAHPALADDVVHFIERNFHAGDVPRVFDLLKIFADELSTPRVQRSVLFLAGGSLAMLNHYVAIALVDVRKVIVQAEYVTDVSSKPMLVRSMSEPFNEHNAVAQPAAPLAVSAPRTGNGHELPARTSSLHSRLIGGRFVLGGAEYLVRRDQRHAFSVRCTRRCDGAVSIVHLPLIFVAEQLSEHIELFGEAY